MSPKLERTPQARRTAQALADSTSEAMSADVQAAFAHSDGLVTQHLVELRASSRLACAARCSHCCSLDVAATFPEVAHLAEVVETTFATAAVAALRERLAVRVAEDAAQADGSRPLAGRPCPLLVDDLCSAYEARPLACRGWNSAQVDPCAQAAARPEVAHLIPVHRVVRDTAHEISRGIQDGVRESGLDGEALDLPRALHALLQDREGVIRGWREGRSLPRGLRSRGTGPRPPVPWRGAKRPGGVT